MHAAPLTISLQHRRAILFTAFFVGLMSTLPTIGFANTIPELHMHYGLRLSTAGILVTSQILGTFIAAIPWGILIDKYGERICMIISLSSSSLGFAMVSLCLHYRVSWFLLGAALALTTVLSGASFSSGGRLVAGWYAPHERGRAIAIRQTAPPVAVTISSLTVLEIAQDYSPAVAMLIPGIIAVIGLILVLIFVINPPPKQVQSIEKTQTNPYQRDHYLLKVHIVSAVLQIAQQILWVWMPTWLALKFHYSPYIIGYIISLTQFGGAALRILAGIWSDKIQNRLFPVKIIAILTIIFLILLVALDAMNSAFTIVAACLATIFSVADNALEFTAVAECAGSAWAARAISIHSTMQTGATIVFTSPFGYLIEWGGYSLGFSSLIIFPIIAVLTLPQDRTQEFRHQL